MRKAQRNGTVVGLLFIDLDRFKEVNDTRATRSATLLVVEAVSRIRQCVPATATPWPGWAATNSPCCCPT